MAVCQLSCDTGKNTRLLEFLKPPLARNSQNEVIVKPLPTGWTVVLTRYGTFETGTGREVWKARQANPEVNAFAECPWSPDLADITSRHAIRINGRIYQILAAINKDEANETMQFWCRHEAEK